VIEFRIIGAAEINVARAPPPFNLLRGPLLRFDRWFRPVVVQPPRGVTRQFW
jgi:hypothetical protein